MQNLWFVLLFNELFSSTYRKPKCINIFLHCALPAHTLPQCSFFVWTLLPLILSRYYIELIVSHPSWIVTNLKLCVADAPLLAFVVEFWPGIEEGISLLLKHNNPSISSIFLLRVVLYWLMSWWKNQFKSHFRMKEISFLHSTCSHSATVLVLQNLRL